MICICTRVPAQSIRDIVRIRKNMFLSQVKDALLCVTRFGQPYSEARLFCLGLLPRARMRYLFWLLCDTSIPALHSVLLIYTIRTWEHGLPLPTHTLWLPACGTLVQYDTWTSYVAILLGIERTKSRTNTNPNRLRGFGWILTQRKPRVGRFCEKNKILK